MVRYHSPAFRPDAGICGIAAKSNAFTFPAAHGKHLVEADYVMNASALRAFLSAFVLALWHIVPPATLAAYKITLGQVADLSQGSDPDIWRCAWH